MNFEQVVLRAPISLQGLKYHPNLHARRLAGGRCRTISRIRMVIEEVPENGIRLGFSGHPSADSNTLEGGRQAAPALPGSGARPTAIIRVNDIPAGAALRELRERSTRVLTTVHIPQERSGHIMCDCLIPMPQRNASAEQNAAPSTRAQS